LKRLFVHIAAGLLVATPVRADALGNAVSRDRATCATVEVPPAGNGDLDAQDVISHPSPGGTQDFATASGW
jgi:hypothetical protein